MPVDISGLELGALCGVRAIKLLDLNSGSATSSLDSSTCEVGRLMVIPWGPSFWIFTGWHSPDWVEKDAEVEKSWLPSISHVCHGCGSPHGVGVGLRM